MSAGAADRVVIDSEQKAAAAVLSAHHFLIDRNDFAPRQLTIDITSPPREIVNAALAVLAAATTPAALARSGGIDIACDIGGNLHAQLSRAPVRTLRLAWSNCIRVYTDLTHTYNGPAEIVLLAETFKPTAVASLRAGDATQDLTDTTYFDDPYTSIVDTRSMNLRMTGLVPMSQPSPGFYFTGPFGFEVTGFWESRETETIPFLPEPPAIFVNRFTAEHVFTAGYLNLPAHSTTQWLDDETDFFGGRFTTYWDNINGWHNRTETIDIEGLRTHTQEMYGGGRQTSIDGRATVAWDPSRGAGCLSGTYTLKTRVPLREYAYNGNQYQAGELLINGSTTVTYQAPTVPDPTQPWFAHEPYSISVNGLGTFDYVADWGIQNGLRPVAQCGN
jgi:hypothetical protein